MGATALSHGYRVLALIDETWTEFAARCELRTAEDAARRLDEMMFARKGNVRGWAVLDSHERVVSSDTPADWPPPEVVEAEGYHVKLERGPTGSWYAIAGHLAPAGWPYWWIAGICRPGRTRDDAVAAALADAQAHREARRT
jgi:hypothetical protein